MKPKLTRAFLNAPLPIPPGKKKYQVYCEQVRGFYVEVRAQGSSYSYKRKIHGKTYYMTIARVGDITLDQARAKAKEYQAEFALGGNPCEERERKRLELSVLEFVEQKFVPHQLVRKKSGKEDQRNCKTWIIPAFGRKKLSQVTAADVTELHDRIISEGRAPATANRILACVKRLFSLAVQWGSLAVSPAKSVRLHRENNQRERYLADEEIRRLLVAIQADSDLVGAAAIAFLLTTGARRGEALGAKWSEIDLDRGLWTIPNPKGGRRVHKTLNRAALEVLQRVKEVRENEYVFPGSVYGQPRKTLGGVWKRLCDAAGISGARVHDLRHTFASILVRKGVSLFAVQRLLNHSTPGMTQRYAHLAPAELARESEKASQVIMTIAAGGE